MSRTINQEARESRLLDALFLTARHASQVSCQFLRGMASRMAMSFEKYGDVYESDIDGLKCSEQRVAKYLNTGNTEYLIDAANFLMIEFMKPRHRDAHFRATDSSESPGRIAGDGRHIGAASNTIAQDNRRLGGSALRTSGGFYRHEGD